MPRLLLSAPLEVLEVMEAVLTLLLAASSLAAPASAAAGLTLRNRHNQNF